MDGEHGGARDGGERVSPIRGGTGELGTGARGNPGREGSIRPSHRRSTFRPCSLPSQNEIAIFKMALPTVALPDHVYRVEHTWSGFCIYWMGTDYPAPWWNLWRYWFYNPVTQECHGPYRFWWYGSFLRGPTP